jgi:major type 1 subunit fimbrin (pilin)
MFKIQHVICVLAMAVSVGANAASNGTVTFEGELYAETCTLSTGSEDILVTLDKISTQVFTGVGQAHGTKVFDIKAEQCPAKIKQVAAHFEAIGGLGYEPTTGDLLNSLNETDSAKGVGVRLFNAGGGTAGTQIRVGETGNDFPVATDRTVTMTYAGGYVSTAAPANISAGKLRSQVAFVLAYQ